MTTKERILEFHNDNSSLHKQNTNSLKFEILDELLEKFYNEIREEVKQEIGLEFKEWYYEDSNEVIEDAIERITGIKF